MPHPRITSEIVLPFETREAAEHNVTLIRNPKAFESIDVRYNKTKARWEVVLVPKTK